MLTEISDFISKLFTIPAFSGFAGACLGIFFGGRNALRVQQREWKRRDHEHRMACVAKARLRCIKLGTTLLVDPSFGLRREKIGGGGGTREIDTLGRKEAFSFLESLFDVDNLLDDDRLNVLLGTIYEKCLRALRVGARLGTPAEPLDPASEPAVAYEEIYAELKAFENRCQDEMKFMKSRAAQQFD